MKLRAANVMVSRGQSFSTMASAIDTAEHSTNNATEIRNSIGANLT